MCVNLNQFYCAVCVSRFSCVQLFVTVFTVACQAHPTNMSVWSKEKSKFLNNPEERREEAQPLQQPENPKTDCRAASGGGVGDIS